MNSALYQNDLGFTPNAFTLGLVFIRVFCYFVV